MGPREPVGPEVLGTVPLMWPCLEGTWGQQGACGRRHPVPSVAVPPAHASAAVLMAMRMVLLKAALSDALLTSILLTQS